jgi:hypothetical protein
MSSTGSAGQGMMLWQEQVRDRSYLILSSQVIGVQLSAAATAESERRSLPGTPTRNAPYYDAEWKGQDTHKGATSCSTTQPHVLLHPLKFYQEDIVQRNNSRSYGIVLVRNCFSCLCPWLIIMVL